ATGLARLLSCEGLRNLSYISQIEIKAIGRFRNGGMQVAPVLGRRAVMHYLYGYKLDGRRRLVAAFGSEEPVLAYVHLAPLEQFEDRRGKFEQGSALAGYERWEDSTEPLGDEDPNTVIFNPSPSML